MHKIQWVIAGLVLFSAVIASASDVKTGGPLELSHRTGHVLSDAEVVKLYGTLALLPRREQRTIIVNLAPSVKAALWTRNLTLYKESHPGLTTEQRAVIDEGLGLVKTALFKGPPTETANRLESDRLAAHKERAAAVFSQETLYTLFLRLGEEPLQLIPLHRGVETNSGPSSCECGSWFDCSFWYGRGCFHDPGFSCIPWIGCGWYNDEACDGFCR